MYIPTECNVKPVSGTEWAVPQDNECNVSPNCRPNLASPIAEPAPNPHLLNPQSDKSFVSCLYLIVILAIAAPSRDR